MYRDYKKMKRAMSFYFLVKVESSINSINTTFLLEYGALVSFKW